MKLKKPAKINLFNKILEFFNLKKLKIIKIFVICKEKPKQKLSTKENNSRILS
ncbi:Hypothetical Protein SLY_1057 [Strawberry lethal yellows phytoplasma (CPA) str. NZSb11]|uniref:Uncharacterized protein n=1 Tax=Strawberry lethal yellows phytoplasma (CPA) str. NZSb11 TaxID=980422 RepID=R4RR47_PHYAS|nr:Hypothetical Protein SLY_1057 [Strawberry lethal yellows phytoplasma (CPA) str. NZSb11]